ncbi:MAG: hypothetical protein ABIG63_21785 [Chloroflexota bacterium]
MNEQKSSILELAEVVDRSLPRRKASSEGPMPRPGRLNRTALRWLIPNGGTILLVLLIILTQNVWAKPLQSALNAPGPSATTVNYQGRLADSSGNPEDGTPLA